MHMPQHRVAHGLQHAMGAIGGSGTHQRLAGHIQVSLEDKWRWHLHVSPSEFLIVSLFT